MATTVVARKMPVKVLNDNSNRDPVPSAGMLEALEDVRLERNLHGPYTTVEEAIRAMLED